MGFSKQEDWSGLPFPSPGDLPDPGIEPRSPTLKADTLTSEPPGKPQLIKPCFPCGSAGKESACNAGDLGSILGLGRPPEEGKGYPLQYPGLEKSVDCTVHGVTKSRTRLGDFHFHLINHTPTIQFSHSVVSNSLQPHGLQHARLPCPSPTPGTYSDSCPLRQ